MCLSKAYPEDREDSEPVLEDIALLEVEEDTVVLTNLFGEEKEVSGNLKRVDFQNSEIYIEEK